MVAGVRCTGGRAPAQRLLQRGPPLLERLPGQVLVAEREQVEGDERRRGRLGQQRDPGRGRVDALLQRLEVQPGRRSPRRSRRRPRTAGGSSARTASTSSGK